MKKTLSLIIFFTSLILSTSLYADGIGAYFSGGGGTIDWMESEVRPSKNYFIGVGFVYDSNLRQDKLFNYRLNIGYDSFIANANIRLHDGIHNIDMKFDRISLINNFGFGLIRTEKVRFWLGLQLGLKYVYGGYEEIIFIYNNGFIPFREKRHSHIGEINPGLVFGLNLTINDYITLTYDLGFRYGYMMVIDSFKNINQVGRIYHHNFEGFGNIGVLYRFNESYAEDNKK